MELKIYSPSEEGFLKAIEFNHEEIKKELNLRLEKYRGLVYSEEEIKLARADRATLNKFKDAIEVKRKEIKAQCLRPYEEFEIKIKEILSLVDKPIMEIDSQVKAFESKQKEEKRDLITAFFNENIGDLKDIFPLAKIWSEKWLNVTVKLPAIQEEIKKTINNVAADLKHIEDLKSEFEVQLKDRYLDTLLLSEALALKSRLEEQKKKLEEYKRQQEEKTKVPQVSNNAVAFLPVDNQTEQVASEEPELEMIEFRVWVTHEQKKILRDCILNNKIKCGKVGK